MCEKSHFDDDASLDIKTWCGRLVQNKSQKVCKVDGQQETKHFVQVVNGKTYKQLVSVKGSIVKHNAAFVGQSPCIKNESEWNCSQEIFDTLDLAEALFGGIDVGKKSTGNDIIKVEIEYRNNWNFNDKGCVDPDKLVFGIEVV
jgi:hypothetical protein